MGKLTEVIVAVIGGIIMFVLWGLIVYVFTTGLLTITMP